MITEIRKIITDQINRHVAMTDTHRAWLAKDIADRVENEVRDLREKSQSDGAANDYEGPDPRTVEALFLQYWKDSLVKIRDGGLLQKTAFMAGFNASQSLNASKPARPSDVPATPKPADTLAADGDEAFQAWSNNHGYAEMTLRGEDCHSAWHAAIAWERQQTSAREASLRERLKEAKAKWRADAEQSVAKERANLLGMIPNVPLNPDLAGRVSEECVAIMMKAFSLLHARLTQPSNQSGEAK